MKKNNVSCVCAECDILSITDGYQIGQLFLNNKPIDAFDSCCNIVFDINTFNFHMFPKDPDVFNDVSEVVDKKRQDIIKCMEKREDIVEAKSEEEAKKNSEKEENDNIIFYYGGTGSRGRINKLSCFKRYNNDLFKFISVYYKGINYNLNFMRFSISDNKKINCELKRIQFDRVVNKHINIGKNGKKNIFKIGYIPVDADNKQQSYAADSVHGWEDDENDILEEFACFVRNVH